MEIHGHRHGADRCHQRAAAPYAGVEHIGQRGQAAEIECSWRVVAHPQAAQAVGLGAVPVGRDFTGAGPHVVALDPRDARGPAGPRNAAGHRHRRHDRIRRAPGGAPGRGHRGGGDHHRLDAGRVGLGNADHPVLGGAVGAHRPRFDAKVAVGQRRRKVDRERNRLAQALGMLHHGLQRLRRRDTAERTHHVGVQGVGPALPVAGRFAAMLLRRHRHRCQRQRLVEGVQGGHVADLAHPNAPFRHGRATPGAARTDPQVCTGRRASAVRCGTAPPSKRPPEGGRLP